jgi:excisionase family DNA binding protein
MKKASKEQKVTIKAAAKALGVSKGTVIHYLNNGRLTRIKDGSQVYILMDEIRALRDPDQSSQITAPVKPSSDGDGVTVALDREHYEELLTRLGQLESENKDLLKYRDSMVDTKAALSQQEKNLQQAEAKLHMMEEELRRLKKMGWWKRVFGRGWRMTGG